MKDEEIVELYWQRSEDAIKATDAKYKNYLCKIADNVLYDMQDSEECVNDTYLAAWNSMPEHRPSVLSTYLGRITRQLAINVFRKKNSQKRRASQFSLSLDELDECFADSTDTEKEYDRKLLDNGINTFVRSLPDEARNIFVGRYYFFDSVKTIAEYCGVSESKVKTVLLRTRRKLREYLEKEGFKI